MGSGADAENAENGTPADALSTLPLGLTIGGRYRVVGRLGRGGMGDVVEVEHLSLGRRFALKALRRDLFRNDRVVQRFRTEWSVMAALRSEHVVAIVDTGALDDGVPYFVMERLMGEDLRSLLSKHGRLPAARVAELGIDACYGLSALHGAGLVHRDIKPENLFVTSGDDGRDILKLLDLGVAKILGQDMTGPGALIGTARYMAPEQIGEDGSVGPAADIFALGVILYECLSGRRAFDGDTLERVLFKIMNSEPEPLGRLCPEAPLALLQTIERALFKAPGERHESATAFASALARAIGSPRKRVSVRSVWLGAGAPGSRGETTVDVSQTWTPNSVVTSATPRRAVPRVARFGFAAAVLLVVILAIRAWRAPPLTPLEPSTTPGAIAPAVGSTVIAPAAQTAIAEAPRSAATLPEVVPSAAPPPSGTLRRARRAAPSATVPKPPRVAFDPANPYGN